MFQAKIKIGFEMCVRLKSHLISQSEKIMYLLDEKQRRPFGNSFYV